MSARAFIVKKSTARTNTQPIYYQRPVVKRTINEIVFVDRDRVLVTINGVPRLSRSAILVDDIENCKFASKFTIRTNEYKNILQPDIDGFRAASNVLKNLYYVDVDRETEEIIIEGALPYDELCQFLAGVFNRITSRPHIKIVNIHQPLSSFCCWPTYKLTDKALFSVPRCTCYIPLLRMLNIDRVTYHTPTGHPGVQAFFKEFQWGFQFRELELYVYSSYDDPENFNRRVIIPAMAEGGKVTIFFYSTSTNGKNKFLAVGEEMPPIERMGRRWLHIQQNAGTKKLHFHFPILNGNVSDGINEQRRRMDDYARGCDEFRQKMSLPSN